MAKVLVDGHTRMRTAFAARPAAEPPDDISRRKPAGLPHMAGCLPSPCASDHAFALIQTPGRAVVRARKSYIAPSRPKVAIRETPAA